MKEGRRQGRQKERWENNIEKWTDLEFAKSQRAVENREKWRKLVVKSSVLPQRLLRLRDRRGKGRHMPLRLMPRLGLRSTLRLGAGLGLAKLGLRPRLTLVNAYLL